MEKLQRTLTVGGMIIIILLGVLVFMSFSKVDPSVGTAIISAPSDLVGTKTGTSTVGIGFYASTTRSYVKRIGANTDNLALTLMAIKASSTSVNLNILASNDKDCDTATTSADVGNPVLMRDVNWFDAGSHILNLAGASAITTATSTIGWYPSAGQAKEVILTNLNAECLKFNFTASGIELWSQIKKKGNY